MFADEKGTGVELEGSVSLSSKGTAGTDRSPSAVAGPSVEEPGSAEKSELEEEEGSSSYSHNLKEGLSKHTKGNLASVATHCPVIPWVVSQADPTACLSTWSSRVLTTRR